MEVLVEMTHASIACLLCAIAIFGFGLFIALGANLEERRSFLGPMMTALSFVPGGVGLWTVQAPTTLSVVGGAVLVLVGAAWAWRFTTMYRDNHFL